MKGDFTRLTFRPDKHYTSVLMQQGRLQLDSDWNEQADIQAHLYRTQVVDLIGAESGAPTSENDPNQQTDKAYKDSFKISETSSNGEDLVISPGRFYVNGTLCELEATRVKFEVTPSNQVKVNTLIVDGQKFEEGQWIKVVGDQKILKINREINTQTLELPLNDSAGSVGQRGELSRTLTYKTQSDHPNSEPSANGLHLAYLDVWQRHITTIEDPGLREPALNLPDTTTRTKTVWQLKLQPLNRKFIEDSTVAGQTRTDLLSRLNGLSVERLKQSFEAFLTANIPLAQQGDTKGKFEFLLNTVVNPSTPSWRQQFEDILKSLLAVNQDALKTALDNLLITVQLTDVQPFDQLLAKVTLTPAQETNLKIPFNALLAKVVPPDPDQQKSSYDTLLARTTSTQEDKKELQHPFDELLSKITLTTEEKAELQSYFNDLQAAPTSASDEEKTRWTASFNALLPKIDQLTSKGNTFQADFKTFLDKAIASDQVLKELESYERDETIADDLSKPEWISFTKDAWSTFPQRSKRRKPYMNACAKLCTASGSATSSDSRYRRLENQLYRVEIHDPGKVGDDQSEAESKKATFKWSRDNGSIVSIIENYENFEKGIITIRKSAQDAWTSSKSGQWIEILDEERELKGQPGQLARLSRVSGNKIEFDVSSLVGEKVQKSTKVRRWDHMTKEASILTRTEWVELEAGIKVQFDKESEYKTGDYWLIPARAATNDIEWSDNQAEDLNKRQPLPQTALGIEHDYALLAAVEVVDGKFSPLIKEQDHRFIFPALAYTFDTREGVIKGNLDVQGTLTANNLNVSGRFSAGTFQGATFAVTKDPTSNNPSIYGSIRIGENPNRVEFVPDQASIFAFTKTSKVGIGVTDFSSQFGVIGNVAIGDATFLNSTSIPQNGLIVKGNAGFGTPTPKNQLDVFGAVAIGQAFAGTTTAPANGLLVDGKVAIGIAQPDTNVNVKLHVNGTVKATAFDGDGSALTGVVKTEGNNVFSGTLIVRGSTSLATPSPTTLNSTVGIGVENPASKLTVKGNAAIGKRYDQTEAPKDGLLVEGGVGIGTDRSPVTLNAKLEVQGASSDTQKAALNITNSQLKNLLWVRNDGKVGIGIENLRDIKEKLHVDGSLQVANDIKCDRLFINADELPGDAPTQDNPDPMLYVNGSLLVEKRIFAKGVLEANEFQGSDFKQISSRTLKDQVSDLSSQEVEEILQRLNPVKYVYTEDATQSLRAGFIAEDTPDLLTSSDKQAIKILDVVAVLTKAVKDQQMMSEELSEVIENQRSELEILRENLRALEERNLDSPQAIAPFINPLDEQIIERSSRTSRRTEWLLYRKLKRFIRQLFGGT
ncbi:MAG: tail fiber domain-containing protein [Drouetiella hepatica Uher 2000/2452]|jgi:hypothetical protein|uniref:Tail fiber domain-containing protein n=1 Tax=Drouetiella hepatica Uher 2000/2452 TaxID=904376 RepID=A0A951QE48_9CYAN|nr:tail fiber domain-containing protein [Drouetiella hepatica Uher 2000/2452]